MNRYRVIRYDWDSDGEQQLPKEYLFEAESFEFLAANSNMVVIFKDIFGEMVGAVNGFDSVRLVPPPEDPESLKKVDEFLAEPSTGTPRVRPVEPDTMAA